MPVIPENSGNFARTLWHLKPRALQYNSETLLAFGRAAGVPKVKVIKYNHGTQLWTLGTEDIWALTDGAHSCPTLNIDSNNELHAFIGTWGNPLDLLLTKRADADDADLSWDSATTIEDSSGGRVFGYPLIEIDSNDELILVYSTYLVSNQQFRRRISTDGGVSWTDYQFLNTGSAVNTFYAQTRIVPAGVTNADRFYTAWAVSISTVSYDNIYCIFTEDATIAAPTWYAFADPADDDITSELPFLNEVEALVYDSVTAGAGQYDWCYMGAIGTDDNGLPHIIFGLGDENELMPNQVDRDFSGASAWADNDLAAYDATGDLTITADGIGQYCTLPVASAPTTIGVNYTLQFEVANLVSIWTIKSYDGTQTLGTVSANGTNVISWTATTTGGYRIVSAATDSSADFDDFTLVKTNKLMHATWDDSGKVWTINTIDIDEKLLQRENNAVRTICDADILVTDSNNIQVVTTLIIEGQHEVVEYTTDDGGATWSEPVKLSESTYYSIMPTYVRNAQPEHCKVLWISGVSSAIDYDAAHTIGGWSEESFIQTPRYSLNSGIQILNGGI